MSKNSVGLEIKHIKIYLLGILFLGNMISKDTVCQRFLFFVYRENKTLRWRTFPLEWRCCALGTGLFFFFKFYHFIAANPSPSTLVQTRSVMLPHGLQPARLLCPWAFPGKNTGVGCHFLQAQGFY